MGEGNRIAVLAMGELDRDVNDTIRHLENGAGHVAGCPGHASLAHGVVLCLKLLRIQIRGPGSTGKHLAASGMASFVAILVAELVRNWAGK